MTEKIHISDFENPLMTDAMNDIMVSLDGVPIALDSDSLVELAKAQIDVPFSYDEGILQRFAALYEEVEANGPLHNVGRMALQNMAVEGLADHSRLRYLFDTYPAIATQRIERPIIVVGMPRSGSTHLLKLLSTDPSLRTIKRWQTYQSFPNKAVLEGREADNRIENGVLRDQMLDVMAPHFRGLFDVEADDATEEIEIMGKGCYGVVGSFNGYVPNYDRQFYDNDQTEAYRYLYQYLQALQWLQRDDGAERWLLKSPQHMAALPAINNVFPDACMVFTHRDPASVFTSLLTLTGYILRISYSQITKEQILAKTRCMQHGFLRGIVRDIDQWQGPVEHIYFDRFMNDKMETVERVFRSAGLNFDAEAQQRVRDAINDNPRGKRGEFVYDLEGDFGLTRDQVREEFSYYIDRFPVAIEETHK